MSTTAQQQRILLAHPAGWLALGLGSGLSPVAPGTAGSLAALLPWLLLRETAWPIYAACVIVAFALGVWACGWVVRTLRIDDPGFVVWDEFVGQWIAAMPLLFVSRSILWIFGAFILFRIFDIWKPWPVSLADRRVAGGLGVMLDDVIAAFYAAAALSLALFVTR